MRRTDEATSGCGLVHAHPAHGFKRSLTEVLGEHILSALSLAMAGVTDDRDGHATRLDIVGEDLFKAIGETEEVGVGGKSSLENTGSNSHLLRLVLKRRAVKIALVLVRLESSLTGVLVHTILSGLRRPLDEVMTVLLRRVLVDGHGVLKVVLEVGLLRLLKQSSVMLLVESSLISRLKFVRWALISTTLDTTSKTLGSILSVSLTEGILTLDTRDEASVTRNLLGTHVMEGSIDPSARVTAKISYCDSSFSLLKSALHATAASKGSPVGHGNISTRLGNPSSLGGMEVRPTYIVLSSSLSVSSSSGKSNQVVLERNVT